MIGTPSVNSIFKTSVNCRSVVDAQRAAFIVDGEAYYGAIYDSFRRAQRSIFIVGWDVHSDLRLVRENAEDSDPSTLSDLLNALVTANEDLQVYLLIWDFAMIYALEREFFPRYKLKWRTHANIHFCLDGRHPVGASQHQKIVVVDDAVAFAGGFDLSKWRWDTPAHRLRDDRRIDPDGKRYPPFHDVQMAVDGQAAEALGRIARERWYRATGRHAIDQVAKASADPWPAGIDPDVERVRVAVARTLPAHGSQPAVREIEQLYLDSIEAARRTIYVENQYLSSHRVGQALRRRLDESDGPEIVIVLPQKTGGWLEQHTMDILRGRILRRLRESDRYNRLRTFYPRIAEDSDGTVMVHAKVMVIDDDFVRVGSSNLSNRSMGLDSECDLAIAAEDDEAVTTGIVRFRNRLLAEHLGCDIEDVSRRVEETGSLIKAIEALQEGERTLVPLSGEVPPEVDEWVPESELLDPEKPVEPNDLLDHVFHFEKKSTGHRHLIKIVLLIVGILALAALWRLTPAEQWVDMQRAQAAGEWIRQQPFAPLLVIFTYILGGMIAFPVTLMLVATVIVFGSWWGAAYGLVGATLSALVVFGVGRALGRDSVQRFAGSQINRLSQKLAGSSGLAAIITFRILPVAPFSVINLIAGVSEIRLKDFAIGTVIGMLPGLTAIALLADRVSDTLRHPDMVRFTVFGVVVVLVAGGFAGLRRWAKHKRADQSPRKSVSATLDEKDPD